MRRTEFGFTLTELPSSNGFGVNARAYNRGEAA